MVSGSRWCVWVGGHVRAHAGYMRGHTSWCKDMLWEVGPHLLDRPGDESDGTDMSLGSQLDMLWTHLVDRSRMCLMVWTHHWGSREYTMSGELRLSGMLAIPDVLGAVRLASDASEDVSHVLGMQGCIRMWWTMVEGPNDVSGWLDML